MTKSMQFSAKFGKFMFYFGNIIIGIIFVSPLIWMISASFKPEAEIFANMDSLTTFPNDTCFFHRFLCMVYEIWKKSDGTYRNRSVTK